MSDHLPEEVWMDIFKRLPVKTLLRIRSVCKFLNSIIINPSFISDHLTITKQYQIPLVRYLTGRKKIERKEHYLLLPNDDMDDMQELDFPFKSKPFEHFQIAGSCNGLLCLSDSSKWYDARKGDPAYGIILWNPSIKKYLTLPKPPVTLRSHGNYRFVLGFGFDWKTDDYKVVRIANFNGKNPPEVELYTVKSGSWRKCNAGAAPYGIWSFKKLNVFVEGAVHWNGYSRAEEMNHKQKRNLIVAFDLSDEVFKEVYLPDKLEEWGDDLCLAVLGNKLAAIHYDSWKQQTFDVWVMEEYGVVESWRELYTVSMMVEYMNFVGFTDNGEILVEISNRKLALYDPNDDLMYSNLGVRAAKNSFHMEMYMESLVLLDGESAVSQSEPITCEGEAW